MPFSIDYALYFINILYRNITIPLIVKILVNINYFILRSYLLYKSPFNNPFIKDPVIYPGKGYI